MNGKDSLIDKAIIFGNMTFASIAKAFSLHDFLTNTVLFFSMILAAVRVLDWVIKRFRFGWPKDNKDEKDSNE